MQGTAGGAGDGEFIDNIFKTHLYYGTGQNAHNVITGIDMSAFFEVGGRYFLTTEFEGLDVRAADANNNKSAMPFEAIQTLFRVEDGNLNWYSEDVIVNEDAGSAAVTINLSRPVAEDVTFTYVVYPATYGFINDDDTLETVKVATGADFADGIATWTGPNGEAYPVGTVTIPAGTTSEEYLNAYEFVLKKIIQFKPEFILLSAGFDAHKNDPLAQFQLESKDFYTLTKRTLKLSKLFCEGKVVSILEGGYDLLALQESTQKHVEALLEFN